MERETSENRFGDHREQILWCSEGGSGIKGHKNQYLRNYYVNVKNIYYGMWGWKSLINHQWVTRILFKFFRNFTERYGLRIRVKISQNIGIEGKVSESDKVYTVYKN